VPVVPAQRDRSSVAQEPTVRVQGSLSVVITGAQLDALHVGVATLRLRVPVASHISEKPPHALQLPVVVVPQEIPMRSRVQARLSGLVASAQVPAMHARLVTVRV